MTYPYPSSSSSTSSSSSSSSHHSFSCSTRPLWTFRSNKSTLNTTTRRYLHTSLPRSARHKQEHYSILQISKNATRQQIKAKFYELSRKHHPDLPGGNKDRFMEISEAHAVLSDEAKRKQYDRLLSSSQSQPSGPGSSYRTTSAPQYDPSHRGPSSSQAYWSKQRPPPPPPTGTGQNGYSPFGRRTPSGYGGPATGTYGSPFQNPFTGSRTGAGPSASSRRSNASSMPKNDFEAMAAGGGFARVVLVGTVFLLVVFISSFANPKVASSPASGVPTTPTSSSPPSPPSSPPSRLSPSSGSPLSTTSLTPSPLSESMTSSSKRIPPPSSLSDVITHLKQCKEFDTYESKPDLPMNEIVPRLRTLYQSARRVSPDDWARYMEWKLQGMKTFNQEEKQALRDNWRSHLKVMGDEVARLEGIWLAQGVSSLSKTLLPMRNILPPGQPNDMVSSPDKT